MNMQQDAYLLQALDEAGAAELDQHQDSDRRISYVCVSLLQRCREVVVMEHSEDRARILAAYLQALHTATSDQAWSSPGRAAGARALAAGHLDALGLKLALQGHPADHHREVQA